MIAYATTYIHLVMSSNKQDIRYLLPSGVNMDLLESKTQSFIIKVWIEETAVESGSAVWRGHITHVPTGKRKYLKKSNEILNFINPYLDGMGVTPSIFRRVKKCLKRRKHSQKMSR